MVKNPRWPHLVLRNAISETESIAKVEISALKHIQPAILTSVVVDPRYLIAVVEFLPESVVEYQSATMPGMASRVSVFHFLNFVIFKKSIS